MEKPSIHGLSTPSNEFTDPSTSTLNELHPMFIAMVRNRPFSGADYENPIAHLIKFERLCFFSGSPKNNAENLEAKIVLALSYKEGEEIVHSYHRPCG
jgi:hypothetical protein